MIFDISGSNNIHIALFCAQTIIALRNCISELSVVSIFHAHTHMQRQSMSEAQQAVGTEDCEELESQEAQLVNNRKHCLLSGSTLAFPRTELKSSKTKKRQSAGYVRRQFHQRDKTTQIFSVIYIRITRRSTVRGKELAKCFDYCYQLPSQNYFSRTAIPALYAEVCEV